jgi:protein-S-isoprenylcysteine O-methyltransferase Ste14
VAGAAERAATAAAPHEAARARDASPWLRVRPPLLAMGLALAALLAHAALWGTHTPLGRAPLAGGALAVAGIGWMTWAWWCFLRAGTPIRPTEAPRVLVDEGPFAYGRNPMYLGIAAALAGVGLAAGVPALAVAAVAFVAVVQRVHVPHEEAALERTFGGWYSDYAADVPRWF